MEVKFYVCKHCGNIIVHVKNSGVKVVCCGEKMQELSGIIVINKPKNFTSHDVVAKVKKILNVNKRLSKVCPSYHMKAFKLFSLPLCA